MTRTAGTQALVVLAIFASLSGCGPAHGAHAASTAVTTTSPSGVERSSSAPGSAQGSPSTAGSAPGSKVSASSSVAPNDVLPFTLSGYAGKDIVRLPTKQKVVALTFDAGANADAVPEILGTLQAEHVPATFFLTGAWVQHFPEQARLIGASFPVGNHSLTHPHFTTISSQEDEAQVTGAESVIRAGTGRDPKPMFRFPYGDRDTRTRQVVNGLGYVSVFWTIDTRGWQGTSGGQSVALVTQRVLDNLQPGEIVLMHVGSHPIDHSTLDGDALKGVIEQLKANGYGFVTIPQGLGLR